MKDPANANDKVSENVLKCADYVIYEGEEVKVPSISSEVNIQVEEEGLLSIQIPCSTIVVAREESGTSCKEENTASETKIEDSELVNLLFSFISDNDDYDVEFLRCDTVS